MEDVKLGKLTFMRGQILIGSALVAFAMVTGCTDQGSWPTPDSWLDHRAASSIDPWFHPGLSDQKRPATQLDATRWHPVVEEKEHDAELLLANASSVELSERDAAAFMGTTLASIPDTKPYLVRGVYLNWSHEHAYIVTQTADNDIGVFHGSRGHHAVPMKKRALIVQLEHPPRNVYLSCGMIE